MTAGIIAGTLLLVLAYSLPVNPDIRDASYEILEKEGWYPRASITAPALAEYFHSFYPDVLDNSSDKIMLYTAMDASEGNPLVRAMNSYSEYSGAYNYYWHGYVSILRPLFLFLDFSELRFLNGACQLLLVILMMYTVGRAKGIRYIMMLLTSYLLLNPGAVSKGLQFSWVFYIAWGCALILVRKKDYFSEKTRYLYLFIAAGFCTSYFDLLTYPLAAWGFPLVWLLVTDDKARNGVEWVKRVVISGIGWIAGYAVMWMAKWVLASWVLGTNVFETAMDEVFFRSGIPEEGADSLADRLNAIAINWKHYSYKLYAAVLLLWLIWWILGSIKKGWNRSGKGCAYFLTATSSAAWYFVLSNHTSIHHFFTYRIFSVSILAFLALVLDSMQTSGGNSVPALAKNSAPPAKSTGGKRNFTCLCLFGGATALLAAFCTLAAREKLSVSNTNGGSSFRQIQMSQTLETEFIPAYRTIRQLSLGLECGESGGQYTLSLWDGDNVIYLETFPIEGGEENNYQKVNVSWRLRAGSPYRMTVEAADNNAPVLVWATEKEMPLTELANLSVDDNAAEGQLLMGIDYDAYVRVPRELLAFVFMTWTGVWMSAFCAFSPKSGLKFMRRR